MQIIFHSHVNKTHFHKKGCAPSLILKVKVFGTRKWPINFSFIDSIFLFLVVVVVVFLLFFLREKSFTNNYLVRRVYAWFNGTCYDVPPPPPPGHTTTELPIDLTYVFCVNLF